MKKTIKLLSSFTLTLILLLSTTLTIFAADSTVTFNGESSGFTFTPGSEYTQTDLFDNFKDVMPGDTLTETITVSNKSKDSDYIKLYIRALAHDEEGNPLTYNEAFEAADGKDQAGIVGQRDETVATMADFLAQLSMKIYNGETLIFDASPDELDGLAENVLLGTFRQGESGTLKVELKVPIELGNEYASRVGEVDWIFTVEALDDPKPTPTPTPTPTPDEEPEEEPQPESTPTPEMVMPSTGDNANLGLYIGLMLASIVILLVIKNRLSKHNKE